MAPIIRGIPNDDSRCNKFLIALTLYDTSMSLSRVRGFSDTWKEAFENSVGQNIEMLVPAIFSMSHNVLYPLFLTNLFISFFVLGRT